MPYRTFNLEEASDYLHLPRYDVEQLCRSGSIPCQTRGGRLVFLRGELDAWASRHILGLPEKHLDSYHQQSSRGARRALEAEVLIPELMHPDWIEPSLASRTRHSVIGDLVSLAEKTGRISDPLELRESIEQREELCPTALPGGLALLHCRNHETYRFEGSFVLLGRTIQDIMFHAPDGRPTRLFFLLCCQDERLHLHLLARFALLVQRTDVLGYLFAASTAEEMFAALTQAELAALAGKRRVDVAPPSAGEE